jgi:hypothetical protein
LKEPNTFRSIPDANLRGAVEGAIAAATERRWPLFIAMKYRGAEGVRCFDACLTELLSEFLESCAQRAFPSHDRQKQYGPPSYSGAGDAKMMAIFERAETIANELGAWYFCAFVPEARVATSVFEWSASGKVPPDVGQFLGLCFRVGMSAFFGTNCAPVTRRANR